MLAATGSAENSLTEKNFSRVLALIDCHTLTRLDVLHLFRLEKDTAFFLSQAMLR